MPFRNGSDTMDIRHLIYFTETARSRSFTKASQHLHVTQPSISKMIKGLEDELGVTLLNRTTKQLELTDAGKAVFNKAQEIVSCFHNLTTELNDVMHLNKGSVIIGLPPMVGVSFFPKVIGEFNKRYPDINLQLIEVGSKAVETGVEEGSLDLGVVALPAKDNVFNMVSFVHDQLMLVVHPGHPLQAKTAVHFSDLRNEPFILYREDFSLHDRILERCIRAGFRPRIICESSQWDFMAEMAAQQLGITLLPHKICAELDPTRFTTIPFVDPIPWHLAIIWKKMSYLSFAARQWLYFISDHFKVPLTLP